MLDALKTLIKAESLVQPAILLLEDAHWLDDESRQFLDQLTRNVGDFPFAVVVTQRPVDGTAAVATDDGSHTLIQLNGLDDEQTELIVTALLDGPPSTQLAALIASRANGNPSLSNRSRSIYVNMGRSSVASTAGNGPKAIWTRRRFNPQIFCPPMCAQC